MTQSCVVRAWSVKKPLLFAPAMNTDMWDHPVTARHLATLESFGYTIIPPVEKMLACGVVGALLRCLESLTRRLTESLTHTVFVYDRIAKASVVSLQSTTLYGSCASRRKREGSSCSRLWSVY